ncbi:putative late blight resistance protein R1A-3 [Salvia divinorum]|uniref:Late blight resistance protein R1A-3 n=1 Tax=Salvia divinorum TaxID=28513 RepID=A0ABD1GSS1_SALDI
MDVATYAAPLSTVHTMRFLDDGQSWRLFRHKVFGDKDYPFQLYRVGEKIVKECGGHPLSIVTVAGLLSKFLELQSRGTKLRQMMGSWDQYYL